MNTGRRPMWWMLPLLLLLVAPRTGAWHECDPKEGGGICPDRNTCCAVSSDAGGSSSCIPARAHDPVGARGECCPDGRTGCGYGYACASSGDDDDGWYCRLREDHPADQQHNTSRYDLCSVPRELSELHGFPVPGVSSPSLRAAYYSSGGDLTVPTAALARIERVLVVIHGSQRNADDYFCAGLSLLGGSIEQEPTTLVLVPEFAAPADHAGRGFLEWADAPDEDHPLAHSWRYGADALNAPVSSYAVVDALLEYLSDQKDAFPNLRRFAVFGHSAGGQVVHRWALLSRSPVWESLPPRGIRVVAVVANPRSYCYLDERRVMPSADDPATLVFGRPDPGLVEDCPGYDEWQWGLADGGRIRCPYRDAALAAAPDLAREYASRRVVYLSGEFDVLPTNDGCETHVFQGPNRQQRALRYFRGLTEYFAGSNEDLRHELHVVAGSPHDHTLMLQSPEAKRAILGDDETIATDPTVDALAPVVASLRRTRELRPGQE